MCGQSKQNVVASAALAALREAKLGSEPMHERGLEPLSRPPLGPTLVHVFVRVCRALGGSLCVWGGHAVCLCACTRALRRSTCASCVVVWVLVRGETHAKTIVSGAHTCSNAHKGVCVCVSALARSQPALKAPRAASRSHPLCLSMQDKNNYCQI